MQPVAQLAKSVSPIAILLCAAAAGAQDKLLRRPFESYDRNKDGVVTEKEFPGNPALFALMDKNRDKKLTFDEYKVSSLARRFLAAVRTNNTEPRPRVDMGDLASRRLDHFARFDKNHDGKLTKSEWTGSPAAFRSLDVDGNGVVDKRDRKRAKAEREVLHQSLDRLPAVKSRLPDAASVLRYYDKDKDTVLDAAEVARSPLKRLMGYGDTNKDKKLDLRELGRLINRVNSIVSKRDQGYARARAPQIPFRAWDKNDDGRLDLKEWVDRKYLFKLMDINRDAAVTETEVLRYKRAFEGRNFIEKFDLNDDNRVTPEEFAGTRAAFDRADRNGDGVISARDR